MIERICMVLKGTAGVPHAVFWSAWGLVFIGCFLVGAVVGHFV